MIWLSGLLALFSLLAVFKAPALPFWFAAIIATEWGHVLAILALGVAAVAGFSQRNAPAVWVALAAAVFFLTPLARAIPVAQRLPRELSQVLGSSELPRTRVGFSPRARPLDGVDLWTGIAVSSGVRITELIYDTRDGIPLAMDFYEPSPRPHTPLPVLMVVHGGSWRSGGRKELTGLNRYLAARGYGVASIDYRVGPKAKFPAAVEDVFSAITYLKQHAAERHLNPHQFAILGRSAGGQIALAAAYAGKEPAIKGVIAMYAPIDLVWGYAFPTNPLIMDSRKVLENYLGGPPDKLPQVYEAASPLFAVNARTPSTLMIHGQRDELVSRLHNERLIQRLDAAGAPYFYLRLPWATHGCDLNFSGPSGQLSTYAVERFLASLFAK